MCTSHSLQNGCFNNPDKTRKAYRKAYLCSWVRKGVLQKKELTVFKHKLDYGFSFQSNIIKQLFPSHKQWGWVYKKTQQISAGQTVWFQTARCENQKKAKYHLDVRFWGKVFAEGNTLTMKVSDEQNDSTFYTEMRAAVDETPQFLRIFLQTIHEKLTE